MGSSKTNFFPVFSEEQSMSDKENEDPFDDDDDLFAEAVEEFFTQNPEDKGDGDLNNSQARKGLPPLGVNLSFASNNNNSGKKNYQSRVDSSISAFNNTSNFSLNKVHSSPISGLSQSLKRPKSPSIHDDDLDDDDTQPDDAFQCGKRLKLSEHDNHYQRLQRLNSFKHIFLNQTVNHTTYNHLSTENSLKNLKTLTKTMLFTDQTVFNDLSDWLDFILCGLDKFVGKFIERSATKKFDNKVLAKLNFDAFSMKKVSIKGMRPRDFDAKDILSFNNFQPIGSWWELFFFLEN